MGAARWKPPETALQHNFRLTYDGGRTIKLRRYAGTSLCCFDESSLFRQRCAVRRPQFDPFLLQGCDGSGDPRWAWREVSLRKYDHAALGRAAHLLLSARAVARRHRRFGAFIIVLILLNSLALALTDYNTIVSTPGPALQYALRGGVLA